MNRLLSLFAVTILMVALNSNCEKSNVRADDNVPGENDALDKITSGVYQKHDLLKGKRIGIFSFTSLEGKEIAEGKQLSSLPISNLPFSFFSNSL
jgi:hypothetical protein